MYGFPDRRVRVYKELSINLLNNKTMNKWFLAKVRYEKATEKGMNKKVTELYLVDALLKTIYVHPAVIKRIGLVTCHR